MKRLLLFVAGSLFSAMLVAQQVDSTSKIIAVNKGELWYGAAVVDGSLMPFKPGYRIDLHDNVKGNQAAPLLLSTHGRYIWSDDPFAFTLIENSISISGIRDSLIIGKEGKNLRDAFRAASRKFFPSKGKLPDQLLFTKPQYNTWIELVYNQNQEDILKYARAIIKNDFPPGVLMIDDNWAPYYGKFEFRKDRFPDPKAMMKELHSLGFKVMIWVCPFISPDSEVFRDIKSKKLLLFDRKDDSSLTWEKAADPALINWWNGYSAVLDFTNPDAVSWFTTQLDYLTNTYGIDGFKLDAGDPEFYPAGSLSYKPANGNEHTELWGQFGLRYSLNEYRAMWKRGGEPLAERLRDKGHTWGDLQKLIPDITASGLLGYAFACPDMIGGGEFGSFLDLKQLDQQLIVRSAQCSALMPMMQFSVAPWRVLSSDNLLAVKKAVSLREKFVPMILELAKKSAITGEPIVRNMEYVFPAQQLANCHDQFMLGDSILVAPMTKAGTSRSISFPKGTWKGDDGSVIRGPVTITVTVPMDRLPYYRLTTAKK